MPVGKNEPTPFTLPRTVKPIGRATLEELLNGLPIKE